MTGTVLEILTIVVATLFLNSKLNKLQENIKMNQEQIDALAARIRANSAAGASAVVEEKEQVRQAIEDATIDTTELEAAISESEQIPDSIKKIFIPRGRETVADETGTEEAPDAETPPMDDQAPAEVPAEEAPAEEATDTVEEVDTVEADDTVDADTVEEVDADDDGEEAPTYGSPVNTSTTDGGTDREF